MSNFTRTDDASRGAILIIDGSPPKVQVTICLSDGFDRLVPLTTAQIQAALTAPEIAAVRAALPKLYAAAVAVAGGT